MRRIAKFFLIFILSLFVSNSSFAADYRVLVIPDNIAEKPCVDSFIYEESAEFFANQIINRLNLSQTIESPSISEIREKISRSQRLTVSTKESLLRFKKSYNINYLNAKKLGMMFNTNRVLLITTSADSQNYFIRRTFWDLLNIPGASVIDPAIKLSTYAVLIDTDRNLTIWEDTFYKSISVCESRMIANSLSPQTEQLEKIKDYSRMLAPQIAHNVQANIVPATMITRANVINYGPKDFDNILTKKYRWYKNGAKEITKETKDNYGDYLQSKRNRGIEPLPDKIKRLKIEHKERRNAIKLEKARAKAEKARLKLENEQNKQIQEINFKKQKEIKETNIIEINQVTTPSKIEEKKQTPKIINISKDDQLEQQDDNIQEPKLKYYQPKTRLMPQIKNTTINDI